MISNSGQEANHITDEGVSLTLFLAIRTSRIELNDYICTIMERSEININIIKYLKPFEPERIGIYGSFARNEYTSESDIDILVKFKNTISLLDLARIHRELSKILGKNIDLITESSIKNKKLKRYIYNDLKIIFE